MSRVGNRYGVGAGSRRRNERATPTRSAVCPRGNPASGVVVGHEDMMAGHEEARNREGDLGVSPESRWYRRGPPARFAGSAPPRSGARSAATLRLRRAPGRIPRSAERARRWAAPPNGNRTDRGGETSGYRPRRPLRALPSFLPFRGA